MKRMMIIMTALIMPSLSGCAEETGNPTYLTGSPNHLTVNSYVRDIVNHPAFKGFGELLLPRDDNSAYYSTRLTNVASLMPYHGHVEPAVVVETLNRMIDEVNSGKTIFYDFYTEEQKRQNSAKRNTGLFFFRGKPGAPFAVVCPGGGFSYVGSLHEGFPLALEISSPMEISSPGETGNQGYNVFVIRYRIGGERIACEDLAAALSYIFINAQSLGVSTEDYSVWGGSAGARMAAYIGSYGPSAFGGDNLPRPGAVIMQYTGHSDYTGNEPPTFAVIGENDGIASWRTMERRINVLKDAGVDTEFHVYPNLGHGFGLGTGTSAEGWLDNAVQFWEKYIKG